MRKVLRYAVLIGFVLVAAVVISLNWYVRGLAPAIKTRVLRALEDRFDADAQLQHVDLRLFPRPQLSGEGLVIRHKGWNDPKPLLSIKRFAADTDLWTVVNRNNHVNEVRLQGVSICIPPRQRRAEAPAMQSEPSTRLRFSIDKITASDILLDVLPNDTAKDPLGFELHNLTLRSVGPGQAMQFQTRMTNAKPPGTIDSEGTFGPWQRDDPRSTPVGGAYSFKNANLSVFNGIAGQLASVGKYKGVLQRIEVEGSADVPDFALKRGGSPVHLTTTFHSVVDGTDGDTVLDPVNARFLSSEFVCDGGVVKYPGQAGKTVALDATAKHAQMQDILRLIMGGPPVVKGSVQFHSKIVIPPGDKDVIDRLELAGRFSLASARFTSPKVQARLLTLSDRARGISKREEAEGQGPESVASDMNGVFSLRNGVADFASLSFGVPGALIKLKGSYELESTDIDMRGAFRMQARLAETQSGLKHWVLLPFDPFFERDGAGFEVPLSVSGTREHPSIGIWAFHHRFTVH